MLNRTSRWARVITIELYRNVSSGLHTIFLWIHDFFCCLLLSCSVNLVLLKRAELAALQPLLCTHSTDAPQVVTVPASLHCPCHMPRPDLERPPRGEGRVWIHTFSIKTSYKCVSCGGRDTPQTVQLVSLMPQHKQTEKNCYNLVCADWLDLNR